MRFRLRPVCLRPLLRTRGLAGAAAAGVALVASVGAGAAWGAPAPAAGTDATPTLVQADRLIYDEKAGTVLASGHVEVAHGDQLLRADSILYDQNRKTVRAVGHVAVVQPDGTVFFSDRADLSDDLKDGFVANIGGLFSDNSRLAAAEARRYEGRWLVAQKGVYSACDLCAEHPERAPLWQLKGTRITHDNEAKDVLYRDASLEFHGVPVLFTPWFSHPDPTVTRRQGFLTPYGGYSPHLGLFARVPYYFDIAPQTDFTLSPVFSAKDKAQFAGELRHRFARGRTSWNASFARANFVSDSGLDKGERWRGHVFGSSFFNFTKIWRGGADVALTTDKSYLTRYKIGAPEILSNRFYLEGFKGRDYAVANMRYFQDLRPGQQLPEPLIGPDIRYHALTEPGQSWGGRWAFNARFLSTFRRRAVPVAYQGADTRRLALDAQWERQWTSSVGFLTQLSALGRLDGFWADHVPNTTGTASANRFANVLKARPFTQADITFRWPFGRRGEGYRQILEPLLRLTAAPESDDSWKIPNEDSLDVEFDETNLFTLNRFGGVDRVEGGSRATWGLRHSLMGDNGLRIEALAGQVLRLERNASFSSSSGLRDRQSDYVGRLDFIPGPWMDLNYGFRLGSADFNFQRQEAQISAGVSWFRPFVNYLSVQQMENTPAAKSTVEEATFGATSHFARYWTFGASHRRALQPEPGPRTTVFSLSYQDECLQAGVTAQRDHTKRLDVESGDTILFQLYLKNIGGVQMDSAQSSPFSPPPGSR